MQLIITCECLKFHNFHILKLLRIINQEFGNKYSFTYTVYATNELIIILTTRLFVNVLSVSSRENYFY